MGSLEQRLKELDPKTFEDFCFHLIKERHSGLDIKHVEGAGGDRGVDLFMGQLDHGPVIWQCKSFRDGVGKSQKQQIKDSLRRALTKLRPTRWVLCLSVDMTDSAHRWFERLCQSYATRVEIGLMQASDIIHELLHRRALRDHYFPNAVLDPATLRALITRSGELTDLELESLTEENVGQYIQRLEDADARFDYRVTFHPSAPTGTHQPDPRSVFSISIGGMTIEATPRDIEALRLAPPKISITVGGEGVAKFEDMIRTGRPQEFPSAEIVAFSSDLPGLSSIERLEKVVFSPVAMPEIPMRVTFGSGTRTVVYEYVPFKISRLGTEEVELVGSREAFELRLTVYRSPVSKIILEVGTRLGGARLLAAQKLLGAYRALLAFPKIELYNLQTEAIALQKEFNPSESLTLDSKLADLVDRATMVAVYFGINPTLPPRTSIEDLQTLTLLECIMKRSPVPATNVAVVLVKSRENEFLLLETLEKDEVRILLRENHLVRVLFGATVQVGPTATQLERARIRNAAEARRSWLEAPYGMGVEISFEPLGDMFVTALRGTNENSAPE